MAQRSKDETFGDQEFILLIQLTPEDLCSNITNGLKKYSYVNTVMLFCSSYITSFILSSANTDPTLS